MFTIHTLFNIGEIAWIGKNIYYPLTIWWWCNYYFFEGRKSMLMPLLRRFYRRITLLEATNFDTHYNENVKATLKEL